MDQTNTKTAPREETRQQTTYARPKRAEWLRRTNRRLLLLRCGMAVLLGMILLIGVLLLVLPSFKVKEILVEGTLVTTTEQEIIEASGIMEGTEIIGTDWSVAIDNIERRCPIRVENITITASKVKIQVKELERTYMKYGDIWVSLDEDFRVMDVSGDPADFEGLLEIRLPAIKGVSVGEQVQPITGTDLSYVKTVMAFLEENGMTARVSNVDASEKFQVSCLVDGSYRVILGKATELSTKMEIVDEILERKQGADSYAVIDVSDLKRTTYRPVGASEFLMSYEIHT